MAPLLRHAPWLLLALLVADHVYLSSRIADAQQQARDAKYAADTVDDVVKDQKFCPAVYGCLRSR